MADPYRFSVSAAGAVVRDDGKVLAIKRRDSHEWQIPGGIVEPGESLQATARREVQEETGYEVTPVHITGVYQHLRRNIVAIVFRCELDGGSATNGDESIAVEWLDRGQVLERMPEAHACRLLDAIDPRPPVARAHDGSHLRA